MSISVIRQLAATLIICFFAQIVQAQPLDITLLGFNALATQGLQKSLGRECLPGNCNPLLTSLSEDDQHGAFFGFAKSWAPWKQCHTDKIKNDPFANADQLAEHFAKDSTTRLSATGGLPITQCLPAIKNKKSLSEQKSMVTKYYYSMNRIGAALSAITEELYSIDQMVNAQKPLADLKCDTGFDEATRICAARKGCNVQTNALDAFSGNLRARKEEIKNLNDGVQALNQQLGPKGRTPELIKARQNMRNARNQILANNPILEGEKFKDLEKKNFDGAVKAQLADNRARLKRKYDELIKTAECFRGEASDCDVQKTRDLLDETPEFTPAIKISGGAAAAREAIHADRYLSEEMCLQERAQDRDKTAATIGGAVGEAALMGIPMVGAWRAIKLARVSVAAIATAGATTALIARGASRTYDACYTDGIDVMKIKRQVQTEALTCPNPQLGIDVANEQDSCIAAWGFMALDTLPLVTTARMAAKVGDNIERIKRSEAALGRKLSEKEQLAIIKAHDTGTLIKDADGFEHYSELDIKRKANILREAGIKGTKGPDGLSEIRILMVTKNVGNFSDAPAYSARVKNSLGEKFYFSMDGKYAEGRIVFPGKDSSKVYYRVENGDWVSGSFPREFMRTIPELGQKVRVNSRTLGHDIHAEIIGIEPGNKVHIQYQVGDSIATKSVSYLDIAEPYRPASQVYYRTADGRYVSGTIRQLDEETGKVTLSVSRNPNAPENHVQFFDKVEADFSEIRAAKPSADEEARSIAEARARANAENQRAWQQEEARRAREQAANAERERAADNVRRAQEQVAAARASNPIYHAYDSAVSANIENMRRLGEIRSAVERGQMRPEYAGEAKDLYRKLTSAFKYDKFRPAGNGNMQDLPPDLHDNVNKINVELNIIRDKVRFAAREQGIAW